MKLKKLLSCLLVLSLTICASGFMASAADEAIFSDSFERESEPGFYVSNPVLRSYGENLLTNGDFSSDLIKSGDGVYFAVSSNYPTAIENGELTVLPAASKVSTDGAFNINVPIDYMTGGNIYELEMYVKSDSAYPFKMNLNATHLGHSTLASYYGVEFLHYNGNRLMSAVAAPEYERVVTRFSIKTTPSEETLNDPKNQNITLPTHIPLMFSVDWNFDGRTATTDALYIDNIKLRKVSNATPSTVTKQSGMPVYSDANLAGKNAQAIMDVMNSTSNAKDVTLITAYYNADTSLNSILNVYKTSVPGNSTATQRIESPEFTVPADLNGGDIKVFAWDSTSSLIPYLEKTDSEYVGYGVNPGSSLLQQNISGSDVWHYEDSFANSGANSNSSFTEELDTATAKSGIASLCLPTVNGNAPSLVYTTVPVKPDTTYRLEFYAMPTYNDSFTFYVSGACGSVPNAKTFIMPGTLNSKFKWTGNLVGSTTSTEEVTVTNSNKQTVQGARYYGAISGAITGWNKVTYTFTTPPADAKANDGVYSVAGTVGEEGSYWTTFGSNVGIVFGHGATSYANGTTPKSREYAAWIDDVVLYEVTE